MGDKRVVIVSGLAGSGHSTCLNMLEDLGFEAIDNLPASLIPAVVALRQPDNAPLAIGIDSRTRHGTATQTVDYIKTLLADDNQAAFLFLDCDDAVLERRFSTTRRQHPLSGHQRLRDKITAERQMLSSLKDVATDVLDTSNLLPARLKSWLEQTYCGQAQTRPHISVVSFSYKNGLPREADMVFDVRFLQNPHYQPDLQPKTGEDAAVAAYIQQDKRWSAFAAHVQAQLSLILPGFAAEGRAHTTLAFGCTGGKHRSVFTARFMAEWLQAQGWQATLWHQDISRG